MTCKKQLSPDWYTWNMWVFIWLLYVCVIHVICIHTELLQGWIDYESSRKAQGQIMNESLRIRGDHHCSDWKSNDLSQSMADIHFRFFLVSVVLLDVFFFSSIESLTQTLKSHSGGPRDATSSLSRSWDVTFTTASRLLFPRVREKEKRIWEIARKRI